MNYYGNWSTNNGNTFNGSSIESTNKKELKKTLIEIANGNLTGPMDHGKWSITDEDGYSIMEGNVKW
jgi:hypothetical protein